MNFFKKKQYKQQEETQKEFKNVPIDFTYKKVKKWYGTISTSTNSHVRYYDSINRSEAVKYFERQAELLGGTLDSYIGTLKH